MNAAIWLVAKREMLTKFRSKSWRIITVVTLLAIVVACLVGKFLDDDEATKIALVNETNVAQQLETAGSSVGETIETEQFRNAADARSAVESGKVTAFLSLETNPPTVTVQRELGQNLKLALDSFSSQRVLNQQIASLGGDPERVSAEVAASAVRVDAIEPPRTYEPAQLTLAIFAGILVYVALLINGQLIAQGVVEEKTSRIVEILLSTIRPWQLMAGKVLGIGAVAMVQVALIVGVGLVAATQLDILTLPSSTTVGVALWFVLWFLLGYLFYAVIFAATSALVSRQEEVGGITTPATLILVIGYFIGVSILPGEPDSSLVSTLSMIPLFSPTLMPMRLAIGGVPLWQSLLSVGLMLAVIPLMTWACGRIYRNAIMRTGSRVKLRNAWKPA